MNQYIVFRATLIYCVCVYIIRY